MPDVHTIRRSCRARLNLHNDRRRKRVPEQATPRQDLLNPQPRGRRTRTRRKRLPYGEQAASEELDALDAEAAAVRRVLLLLVDVCLHTAIRNVHEAHERASLALHSTSKDT